MKKTFIALTLLMAASAGLQAASITVTNRLAATLESRWIADADGSFIPNGGGMVAIGSFADESGIAGASSVDGLLSAFTQFGDAVSVAGVGTVAGLYANSISASVSGGGFTDQSVFTVIGNGGSLASSSNFLVFKHDGVFPADADNPTATLNAIVGEGQGELLLGGSGTGDFNGNAIDTYTLGVVVPEPSSALLGLLGLSFLAFRRRK